MKTNKGKVMSVREAGRKGGNSTLKRLGIDFYKAIGRKGGRRTAQLYKQVMKEHGKKGGRPRRPDLGGKAGEG